MPTWEVPLADLPAQYRAIQPEMDAAIGPLLARAELIGGPTLERFESAFAARCATTHAIGTSSGTAALHLALVAAGIEPASEVIVPAFTFAATAAAVLHAGAVPVFCDVSEADLCLDPRSVEAAVTARTSAIVAVHLFGRCAPMAALEAIAARHGLLLVEDAAQAFGATDGAGRPAGSLGRFGCFSLHPSKNLGVYGDGGMVTTSDGEAALRLRSLVDHGRGRDRQVHVLPGYNHRLDALQAAVGLVKLRHIDRWTAERRERARRYDALAPLLRTPEPAAGHVYHQYAVRCSERDALAEHLAAARIATARHYARPLYTQPAFLSYAPPAPLPVTESTCRSVLCLPLYPELPPMGQDTVIGAIRRYHQNLHKGEA